MYAKSYENNCLNLIKISIKTFITTFYPPVPNNSTPRLLIFEVFVGTTPFSYLDIGIDFNIGSQYNVK